jgi:carbonic anhydrase
MQTDSSRRQWIGTALAGGIAASAGFARSRIKPAPPPAPGSPRDALALLYAGNRRFVGGKSEAPHRAPERLLEVAAGQAPFAAFLGCADSRVPIEILFDQGFGDLFVTRIAGNVATTVRENVKIQAQTLVEGSTVISSLVSAGKLTVAGGIFDLQTGRVEPVELPFLKG